MDIHGRRAAENLVERDIELSIHLVGWILPGYQFVGAHLELLGGPRDTLEPVGVLRAVPFMESTIYRKSFRVF